MKAAATVKYSASIDNRRIERTSNRFADASRDPQARAAVSRSVFSEVRAVTVPAIISRGIGCDRTAIGRAAQSKKWSFDRVPMCNLRQRIRPLHGDSRGGNTRHVRLLRVRHSVTGAQLLPLWMSNHRPWSGVGGAILLLRPLRALHEHSRNGLAKAVIRAADGCRFNAL